MNKEQGFILKPETYNQQQWYEIFMNLSKEYRKKCNIIDELEKYLFAQLQLYGGGGIVQEYYDKLKELKEGNKDE